MQADISSSAEIGGSIWACLVDSDSGLMLASEGGGALDLGAASALNSQVVRARRQAIDVLQRDDRIDDILITLGKQLHLICPREQSPDVLIDVALDKAKANL
jgi:hypothetical protein